MKSINELLAHTVANPTAENIAEVNKAFGYRIFKQPTKTSNQQPISSSILNSKTSNQTLFLIANVNELPEYNVSKFMKSHAQTFFIIQNSGSVFSADLEEYTNGFADIFGCKITQLTLSEFIDFYNCSESISETFCIAVEVREAILCPKCKSLDVWENYDFNPNTGEFREHSKSKEHKR